MQFDTLKNLIFDVINELQGQNIIYLDMRKKSSFTDVMIICTGVSNNHVITIAKNILKKIRDNKLKFYGSEGIKIGEWILLDLGDIIIHIMCKESRRLYELEKLWS